jgi:hypothetical protein
MYLSFVIFLLIFHIEVMSGLVTYFWDKSILNLPVCLLSSMRFTSFFAFFLLIKFSFVQLQEFSLAFLEGQVWWRFILWILFKNVFTSNNRFFQVQYSGLALLSCITVKILYHFLLAFNVFTKKCATWGSSKPFMFFFLSSCCLEKFLFIFHFCQLDCNIFCLRLDWVKFGDLWPLCT